jgi:hypothetical protein
MINVIHLLKHHGSSLAAALPLPLAHWTQHEAIAHSLGAALKHCFWGGRLETP